MADKTIAVIKVPVSARTAGVLKLKRPTGQLQGIAVDVYVRAGPEGAPAPVGDQPIGLFEETEIDVPARLLKAAKDVAVEATFVLKQPAKLAGSVKLAATLSLSGQSDDTHVTVVLKAGQTSALRDLTFWVESL